MIVHYRVLNLHCGACAARMEEAFTGLPGVEHARIDLDAGRLRLEGSSPDGDRVLASMRSIADAIEPGTLIEQEREAEEETRDDASSSRRGEALRLLAAGILFACGLLGDIWLKSRLPDAVPPFAVDALLYGLPYLMCGAHVLLAGGRSLLRGEFFNEFTLMSMATLAAIGIGALPEAVGVMLFYSVGELVQELAAGRARGSISALLAGKPDVAHVLDGEAGDNAAPRDTRPENVQIGELLLVRPGEKIPLDGVIVRGVSRLDMSPLTGESLPVGVAPDADVFAGTVNLDGVLHVRVTAVYAESSVARVLDMVEHALARKAPTERFITRFARSYTPVVTGLAALVALLPPLAGLGSWQEWLYRALVLLVISCPCALVISVPLGYFGGIGAASRRGVLVKGGHVLDGARDIRTVAFDKTGTLTRGVFAVSRVDAAPGMASDALLRLAARAESHSNHPIARSIALAAQQAVGSGEHVNEAEWNRPDSVREVAGQGMELRRGNKLLLVGNRALLDAHGVNPPESASVDRERGAVVLVAESGRYLGRIDVSDMPRPEAAASVAELRAQGLRVVMLTGDRPESAKAVAENLGLDDVRAGLLPAGKAEVLEELGAARTMFVGDGINDAPVLAAAGIGVAMGGLGAQAAVEAADAVILDDSPSRVVDLLHIARRTRVIVRQNIVLALGVKIAFMGLGIVGLSGLWEAVFADVGVTLLAVLNATRAGK